MTLQEQEIWKAIERKPGISISDLRAISRGAKVWGLVHRWLAEGLVTVKRHSGAPTYLMDETCEVTIVARRAVTHEVSDE